MKTQKQISLLALLTVIMLIIGYIFEVALPGTILFSWVTPSPAEGLLIFVVITLGFLKAYATFVAYIIVLFTIKGLSPALINESALIMSATFTMIIFSLSFKKLKLSFLKSAIITVVFNTIIMTFLNAYFISPSYVAQKWATYQSVFKGMSFNKVLKYVINPLPAGGGILHGNLIKYILCFTLAHFTIKLYKIK